MVHRGAAHRYIAPGCNERHCTRALDRPDPRRHKDIARTHPPKLSDEVAAPIRAPTHVSVNTGCPSGSWPSALSWGRRSVFGRLVGRPLNFSDFALSSSRVTGPGVLHRRRAGNLAPPFAGAAANPRPQHSVKINAWQSSDFALQGRLACPCLHHGKRGNASRVFPGMVVLRA